jgi:hypothetical protein
VPRTRTHQVVYILDQVRALETEMRRRLTEQGLPDITPHIVVVTRLIPQVRAAAAAARRAWRSWRMRGFCGARRACTRVGCRPQHLCARMRRCFFSV